MLQGGDGFVPGVSNVAPRLCVDLLTRRVAVTTKRRKATGSGDRLARLYEQGHWLPALKAACAHLGLGNARPAAPLITADDTTRATIAALVNYHSSRA